MPVERARILQKAAQILRQRNDELAHLEVLDTGKPLQEANCVDIASGADVIEYYAGLISGMQGTQQDLGKDAFLCHVVSLWECVLVLVHGTTPFK